MRILIYLFLEEVPLEYLIIGIAVAANIVFIKMKFEKKRHEDGIFDAILLVLITIVFGGSYGGLVVGTIASAFISLYFYASPPRFISELFASTKLPDKESFIEEFKRRARRQYD